jgi:hypothetical protein
MFIFQYMIILQELIGQYDSTHPLEIDTIDFQTSSIYRYAYAFGS